MLAEIICVFITIGNLVLSQICIVLVKKIGLHTYTAQSTAVMVITFLVTFVNTGILILLTEANTSNTVLAWIPLRSQYTDLDANWYINVGDGIVYTMLINSVSIYISVSGQLVVKCIKRIMD